LTVPIPYDTASGNYIELDVTPSGGPTQTSRLAVSCALNSDLAIPGGLTSATDSSQCVAHMIEDSQIAECDSAFPNHHLVLTWTYDQNGCIDKPCVSPDGYNIYKSVRKGPYALSKVQDHEPGQTAIVFGESHEEAGGSCFKVQAYKGKSDLGEAGAPFCIVPDPVTINASNIVETHSNNPRDEGPLNSLSCPASGGNPLGQKLWTTQSPYHQFDIGLIEQDNSCSSVDSIHGAAVQFDVTHLLPDPIRSAVFQMHVTSTAQNAGTTDSHSNGSEIATANSCAASVGTPSGWKPGDSVPGNIPFNKVASLPNPGSDGFVRVDVTNVVRNWYASSSSNTGLVLSWIFASWNGYIVSNANLNTYMLDRECLTSYDAASLKITYEW